MTRGRVILHIGRNKAGSTSIQHACEASADVLAAGGVGYGLFGHMAALRPAERGWTTFGDLAQHARATPATSWLVSNEFMSAWPHAYTMAAARELGGCDVSVVAYVRRYDQWVRSAYAENTRAGMNSRDFDTYLGDLMPRVSVLPNLQGWALCFGWERLRIRTLDPADLVGGDLLTDFAAAVGLDGGLRSLQHQNMSPHWAELELVRSMTTHDAAEAWGGANREAAEPLAMLMARLAGRGGDVDYLTADQQTLLLAWYERDVLALREQGQAVSFARPEPARPRPFLPALHHVPLSLRRRFLREAQAPLFAARYPAAADAAGRLADLIAAH